MDARFGTVRPINAPRSGASTSVAVGTARGGVYHRVEVYPYLITEFRDQAYLRLYSPFQRNTDPVLPLKEQKVLQKLA